MAWLWYLVAAIWALDALRMRARLKLLPALPPAEAPATKTFHAISAGAEVDERTRTDGAAYAARENIALLDLIPSDTPVLHAMGIVQILDPIAYRRNPIARGHSTGYALLAEDELLVRAGVLPEQPTDVSGLARSTQRLKTFAVDRAAVVVAPSMRAPAGNPLVSWPSFSAIVGRLSRFVVAIQGFTLALLALGLYVAPAAALLAIAVLHLQPIVVFAGLPIRPRDLGLTVLLRTPMEVWNWIRLVRSRIAAQSVPDADITSRSHIYAEQLKQGLDHFFEPRRDTCPLCDSAQLRVFLRTTDLIQHKPGRFTLEQCRSCQHIFQNPRLSPAGLDFYYGDFYDGLGTAVTESLMGAPLDLYLTRARLVGSLATPSHWLDVGTAHGHFCCAAQQAWPNARFDGLDISSGIEQAERAGWVGHGYRGFLPDVADDLAGQYDVVSLFHCLEHTPDPKAEIAAAYTVLEPGGLLVIEVPDPECPMNRFFGRYWFPWFQPQHLHLLSVANLTKLLRQAGFEPAIVQRGPAHLQVEFASSWGLLLSSLSPRIKAPWRQPPGFLGRLKSLAVWTVGFPLIPVTMVLDAIASPLVKRLDWSNAYRIVARRDRQPLRRPQVAVKVTSALHAEAEVV